jgi:NADH:ubiquinone oxidoreductase subunit 2 (subunit N)
VRNTKQINLNYDTKLLNYLKDKKLIDFPKNNLKNEVTTNLINYYQNYLDKSKDYVMIIFFNLFGALLLISSFDLISLYLSIELQSFALYILATFYKESRIVTAAGLKYFLLGALSSCFILLGSALFMHLWVN